MKVYAPTYLKEFKCIADRCRHNCCIGWEIDIDDDTLSFYKTDKEIMKHIAPTEPSHFILSENERCPFLDSDNLCKIIKKYGQSALCQICRDHPRFKNFYESRVEIGLGRTCPTACELI